MLVLNRRIGEQIVITIPPSDKEQKVTLILCNTSPGQSKIGVDAPKAMSINRGEVQIRKDREIK